VPPHFAQDYIFTIKLFIKKKSKPGKFEINRVSKLLFAYKVPAKKNNFCGTNFQTLGHVKLQKLL